MPKYIRGQFGVFGWLVFLPFLGIAMYAIYQLPWLLGVIAVIVVVGTITTKRIKHNLELQLKELAAQRGNESICTFARSFNPREVDTWVIRAVYEQLQDYLAFAYPQFPVRAEDRLYGCLITDPDDLDLDLAKEIAERTGRSLEDTKGNPYYEKVETVRDLVLFFNAQPVKGT